METASGVVSQVTNKPASIAKVLFLLPPLSQEHISVAASEDNSRGKCIPDGLFRRSVRREGQFRVL